MTDAAGRSQDARLPSSFRQLRLCILVLLVIGIAGTSADLLLLHHYEEVWQAFPLVLLGLALLNIIWIALAPGSASVISMRVVMVAFVAAGALGVVLHYSGNSEFQREIDPSLSGWDLFAKVMQAKAPPALAPGSMVQLGLLGLLYTYHHPALRSRLASFDIERS
jgi:hypothetical protein